MPVTSVEDLLRIDCGTGFAIESREVVDDMIAYGEDVLRAHPDLAETDRLDLLDAQLESNFPDVSDVIRSYVIDSLTDEQQRVSK